jgi:hypothetical protein
MVKAMNQSHKRALSMGAALGLLYSVSLSLSAQTEPTLAAYWDFNDASNPNQTLDKLFGFSGSLENGAVFAAGQSQNAIDFGTTSAQQQIIIDDVSFLNLAAAQDQITISFWQSLHNIANSVAFWGVSPSSSGSSRGIQAHTPWGDSNIYFDTAGCCDGGTQRISGNVVAFEPGFASGWHHLAFIKNGTTKQIWVNGRLFLEGTNTAPLPVDFEQLVIGSEPPGGNSIQGLIDEFAVFVGALNPAQVAQLANGTPPDQLDGIAVMTDPLVSTVISSPRDLLLTITDSLTASAVPGSVEVRLNGQPITPMVTKDGRVTSVRYDIVADTGLFFTSGADYTLAMNFQTSTGGSFSTEQSFTIAPYSTIPASYALATAPTTPGWVVSKVHQMIAARGPGDANSTANAEMQLAGGMLDAEGNPRQNIAEFPGPLNIGGEFSTDIWWTPYVNWERAGSQINATGAQPDNFNANEPSGEPGTAAAAYFNSFTPGVELGATAEPENYVVETIAYIQLAAGLHRWGVNSDDGFKVTAGPGQPSPAGITLGEFNGGRGATDTLFDFVVEEAGYYPIRLLYWQGGGGASAEWFSVDLQTGQKILLGDTQYYPNRAYQVFRNGQGRARISTLRPSSGFTGTQPTGPIYVQITDGRTTASNARLLINGQQVATGTKAGTVTTINYTPETPLALGTTFSGQVVYDESGQSQPVTHNFTFTTRALQLADLPADSFWIEAEDFNYGGGQSVAAANTMPYPGGAYQGLNPVLGIDYQDSETGQFVDGAFTDGVTNYRGDSRTGTNPILSNIASELAGTLAAPRPGGFTMTSNYKIGWVTSAKWWNYTRTIPSGAYRAMAAQSVDGGTGNIMTSTLSRVTEGANSPDQTLVPLGTFRGGGSTGWSQNALIPLLTSNSDTAPAAIFTLPGGPVTFRWTGGNGDLDWMVLIPTTDLPPVEIEFDQPTFADGQISLSWTGNGRLEEAEAITGPWTAVQPQPSSPFTAPASGSAKFYRIVGQ